MANGVLDIRKSEMSDIMVQLKKSFANIDKMSENIESSFSNITKTGLLSKCTSKISEQTKTIARQIQQSGDLVSKSYENMYFVEKVLEQKAEEIPTPTDFYKNDVASDLTITTGNLSKNDGKSVNGNSVTNEKELEFKNSIEYNDKLKRIVKEYEDNVGEIEINADKIQLGNISKEEVIVDKEIKDNEIEKKTLENINKNSNETQAEINDNFGLERKNVEMIDNNKSEMNVSELNEDVLEDIQNKMDDINIEENHNE